MSPEPDAQKENTAPLPPKEESAPISAPLDTQSDDEMDPDAAILAHPEWDVSTMLSAATFDVAVPAAVMAAHATTFQTLNFNGMFSLDPYSLEQFFKQRLGELDENGNPKEESLLDEYAGLVADERAEQQQRKADLEETLSESQIDAMSWVGDPDAVWDMDGITASRKDLLAGAKAARKGLKKVASDNGWSDDQLVHETRLVSDYERAIIENRPADAAKAKQEMQPATKEIVDQKTRMEAAADKGVSIDAARTVTGASATMAAATDARGNVLSQMASADWNEMKTETRAAIVTEMHREPALSHPPAIELTEDFTIAASPTKQDATSAPKPTQTADATPGNPPALNQNFNI